MDKIIFLIFMLPMMPLLNADDNTEIRDTRESAVVAAMESEKIYKDAQTALRKINTTSIGKQITQLVGTTLQNMAKNISADVQKKYSGESDSDKGGLNMDNEPQDFYSEKIQKEINEKVAQNLQMIQKKTASLSIPNVKTEDMEKLKLQISESLNAAGVAPLETDSSSKNKK